MFLKLKLHKLILKKDIHKTSLSDELFYSLYGATNLERYNSPFKIGKRKP